MKKKLEYRALTLQDVENVDQLNNIGVSNWMREFFSELKPNSVLVGCFDNDKIVGCEGYVSYKLCKGGLVVNSHRSERTLVNPEYRGMGIFESLINECDSHALKFDSHFSWGATSALKPFERAGFIANTGFRTYLFIPIKKVWYKRFMKLISLVKLMNPKVFKAIFRDRNLELIKSLLANISAIKGMKYLSSSEIEFKEIDLDQISYFQKVNHTNYYQIKLDFEFIAWLKLRDDYKIVQINSLNKCCGYVVVKMNTDANFISIVDVTLSNVNIVKVMSKLATIPEFMKYDSFFLALNSLNEVHKEYIESLNSCGVLNKTQAGSFVIKPLVDKDVKLCDLMLTDLWLEL